jgi:hypothetical protein
MERQLGARGLNAPLVPSVLLVDQEVVVNRVDQEAGSGGSESYGLSGEAGGSYESFGELGESYGSYG